MLTPESVLKVEKGSAWPPQPCPSLLPLLQVLLPPSLLHPESPIGWATIPSFPSIPLPFPSPLPSHLLPSPSLSLEVGSLNWASLGDRCKLPQRGLGQSPSRNRLWCSLDLKSDIYVVATIFSTFLIISCWPQFMRFFLVVLSCFCS